MSPVEWLAVAVVLALMVWWLDWWVLIGVGLLVIFWALSQWTNLRYGI